MTKKYIDAEKLKTEIKRLESEGYYSSISERCVGFYDALNLIKSFINSLQREQSSLSSNFDEAVAKYIESQTPADQGEEMVIYNTFKEGVEWHARQGQTFESVVWQDSDDKLFVEAFVDENKFKMADNVVIQVIKKDNN